MSKINKLTTSFIKIANVLGRVKNQDEYNIYVSMLDAEELECLKYARRPSLRFDHTVALS